jgi:hypothetical protein
VDPAGRDDVRSRGRGGDSMRSGAKVASNRVTSRFGWDYVSAYFLLPFCLSYRPLRPFIRWTTLKICANNLSRFHCVLDIKNELGSPCHRLLRVKLLTVLQLCYPCGMGLGVSLDRFKIVVGQPMVLASIVLGDSVKMVSSKYINST